MMGLENVDDSLLPCIAHNAQARHLNSIIKHGLVLGGDGVTQAVHSQLSAFHVGDGRFAREQSSWPDECYHPLQGGADQTSSNANCERGASDTQTYPRPLHRKDLDKTHGTNQEA